jgi:serine/threonine protein kinase
MKIDFRSRVQISPEFADWLEKMLEPAAEDRFKSAAEALKGFQDKRSLPDFSKQPPQKQSLSTGRQPKGSRIVLSKTSRRLVVKIPPLGWQKKGILYNTFAGLLFLGIPSLVFTSITPIEAGQLLSLILFLLIFIFPFWLSGLYLVWPTVYAFVGSSYLEIDSSSFRLGWKCLCFGNQVQGQTADIQRIERGSKNTPIIREKKHKHEFATQVTPVEKDWLVAEVSDFLERLSNQKS